MRASAKQAVADLRGQIAAGPEPAQDRAQIRVFLGARAAVAAADRARPEQPVRQRVQLGRDMLENVGDAVDDRLDQPDKDLGRAAPRLPLDRCRTRSAVHSAPSPAARAPARSRPGSSRDLRCCARCTSGALRHSTSPSVRSRLDVSISLSSACARQGQPARFLDGRNLPRRRVQQIDPHDLRAQLERLALGGDRAGFPGAGV